jgi:predicted kinase
MLKILMLRGLPASGKSTYAKELLVKYPGQYKRVNKDDLRNMLDGGKWSKENEQFILVLRDLIIINVICVQQKNVIVDDTNLAPIHLEHIKQLIGTNAIVEVKDFTAVPLEECIRRDKTREASVGEKVIRGMYNQFLKPKHTP